MHNYQIIFNTLPEKFELEKEYSYSSVNQIKLNLARQAAKITYSMKTLKTPEEIVQFKSPHVKDAYVKLLLLHAIHFNEGFLVNEITVIVDGEKVTYTNGDLNFPFVFSMLGDKQVELREEWKNIEEHIVYTTKTQMREDYRFPAVYSYLLSKTREYEIDRFSNLWTAMNAYYDQLNKVAYGYMQRKNKLPHEQMENLKVTAEADVIGLAVWEMSGRYRKLSKKDAEKLWSENYDLEKALTSNTVEDAEKLYDDLYQAINSNIVNEEHQVFVDNAERFGLSAFPFFLLEYSYHLRCNLFHGNRNTLLFMAYNDYEYGMLKTVNYFLDRFLNENIPRLFDDEFWNEDRHEKYILYLKNIAFANDKKKLNTLILK